MKLSFNIFYAMHEIESFMYGTGTICCKLQAVNEIKALLLTLIQICWQILLSQIWIAWEPYVQVTWYQIRSVMVEKIWGNKIPSGFQVLCQYRIR